MVCLEAGGEGGGIVVWAALERLARLVVNALDLGWVELVVVRAAAGLVDPSVDGGMDKCIEGIRGRSAAQPDLPSTRRSSRLSSMVSSITESRFSFSLINSSSSCTCIHMIS